LHVVHPTIGAEPGVPSVVERNRFDVVLVIVLICERDVIERPAGGGSGCREEDFRSSHERRSVKVFAVCHVIDGQRDRADAGW